MLGDFFGWKMKNIKNHFRTGKHSDPRNSFCLSSELLNFFIVLSFSNTRKVIMKWKVRNSRFTEFSLLYLGKRHVTISRKNLMKMLIPKDFILI